MPEASRSPIPAWGRSRATASPVTRSSAPTPTVLLLMAKTRRRRVATWTWTPLWQPTGGLGRLEELTRQRRLDGAEADEILDRYQRVATAPVDDPVDGSGRLARRLPLDAAGPRPLQVGGHPHAVVVRRRPVLRVVVPGSAVPPALVVDRHARRQRHPRRGDRLVAARPSRDRVVVRLAAGAPLVDNDFESYYSEFAATSFALRVGPTTSGCRRCGRPRGVLPTGRLHARHERGQPRGGGVDDDPPRPGRPLLRPSSPRTGCSSSPACSSPPG